MDARLAVLEELYDDLVELLRPLDAACLNWTPPIAATNSIAGLVRHTVGSTDAWLARAVGEPITRDRDAEFRTPAGSDELISIVDQGRLDARRRFALLAGLAPETVRTVRRLDDPHEYEVTVAWCVAHAVIHGGEHWGQIQLNRQLYAAR
jgi:hypothetical protein